MKYRMFMVVAGIPIAAAAPMLLHGHPTNDCNPRIELCKLSEIAYLPDEPAPEHAPSLIIAPPVAASTGSTGTVNLIANDLVTGPAVLGRPPLALA
jgi:hypothetical protein